jgi:archaeal flagellar protein FlaJ
MEKEENKKTIGKKLPTSKPDFILKSKDLKKELSKLELETIKRLKKPDKQEKKIKEKKASHYVKTANKFFGGASTSLVKEKFFSPLRANLIKANLDFMPVSYISTILLTTLLSFFAGIFIFLFFLFLNLGPTWPFITVYAGDFLPRFLRTFWILLVVPLATFLFMYIYPSMEKKSNASKINNELPFATIHMSAIAGSMIDPSRIFSIIISTREYPNLSKEFTKLINEINVYGYDLVTALRHTATNSPSKKLADLLNSLATTITSGGNLPDFFDKRSQTLLFDYRIQREKETKAAETFMDIYISVVIAAPMIFMLLLMMIKIGGLGISLSMSTITLLMILGVSTINILFLSFLQMRQTSN